MSEPLPPPPFDADSIVETVREPLLVLSADLRVRRANRSFYQTFGVVPEDTEGRLLYELGNHQWDIPALRKLLEKVLPQNTAFNDFEVAHDFPSIGRKIMVLNARRIHREGDRTESILLAIEDVTERRRVEEALAVQRVWLRVTLRSIGDAVIATDTAGRVTFMNPVAEGLTGWPEAEAQGQPLEQVFRIVNEETRQAVENPVAKSLRGGHIVGLANHTLLIHRDGTERSIDDCADPILSVSGGIVGVVLVFRDISERRRLEREKQAALEYAENIVETVRESMLVLDGDLRVRSANDSFYRTFRVAPAETVNRPVYDLGNRQWDIPALRKLLEEILPQQSSFNDFEVTHDFQSIGQKVMLLNARRVQRDHADTGLILLAIEDITERRRLEDERRELETRFTYLVKNIRDHSIFTLDARGRITSWNREAERILGYGEAEALGQHFSIIFSEEDQRNDIPAHELRTAFTDGRAEDERWHVRKDGERFWALGVVSPIHDAKGQHTGYSKILRDMTERKVAEQEREKFTFLVENSQDFIGMCDMSHMPFFVNRAGLRLVGLGSLEEAIRTPLADFFFPEDVTFIRETFLPQVMRDGRGEVEIRFRHFQTGEPIWMAYAVLLMRNASGHVYGLATISRDITQRKRAEDELRHADRRKDEFLATLAHELRNPLAPIRNGLQLLKLTSDPDTTEQARAMMERQLGQMVRLVDDLLDISRISRNKLDMRKARIDLWGVVQSAVETARPQIEARGHHLAVTLPPQPVYLDGDLTRLAQVFWNLLNNSAKYTEPGGHISLTAEASRGEAVITVRDDGIGIPTASLPTIFDMFSQVGRTLEQAEGGLGIGLALVKGLTEAHGGTVEARSEGVGRGSAFVVRLPLAQDNGSANQQPSPDASQPRSKHRILVVDDNRDGAASLAMLLTVMGNDTRTAHDGIEGVEMAGAFRPDLIVLDIGLPKLNGYEACRRIREQTWGKDMLIVAATGWGQEEDRRRSQEAGFDYHLVKPVDTAEVIRLLAKVRR